MNLLQPDQLPALLAERVSYLDLTPGEILFHDREPAQFIFVLQVGRIQLVRYTCDGNPVVFRIVRAGEIFAESVLFTNAYCSNAIAETPVQVIAYPKDAVWDALAQSPDFALELLRLCHGKSQSLKQSLELRSIRSARDRLLQYFIFALAPGQRQLHFDRSYKDIATELGLSSETLYRSLSHLEKSGLIQRQGRKVELLTPQT